MSTRRLTVKAAIRNSISTITHLPFEPLVTGPLLLVLLRGPDKVRNYLVSRLNTTPGLRRIEVSRFITILKILLAYGVVKYTNALLNSIALNNWRLRKAGTPWDFPNEIVVITGGASGFGKLIAEKLAVKVKKVVVLDVQDPPKEFENSPSRSNNKQETLLTSIRYQDRLLQLRHHQKIRASRSRFQHQARIRLSIDLD